VREYFRNASPELYLVVAIVISIAVCAVFTRIGFLRFGSFGVMAAVLVASDVVIYLLMKLGVVKSPRDRL
jgi:hypothetical protein